MRLEIIRKEFTDKSTIGDLYIDDVWFSFSLEDVDRQRFDDGSIIPWSGELKVPGETAIPYGNYEVITDYSNRFQRVMPHILNVPGFEGVRIHSLNVATETEGCIGVGYTKADNFVGQSRVAFIDFFERLAKGFKDGKVLLSITREDFKGGFA